MSEENGSTEEPSGPISLGALIGWVIALGVLALIALGILYAATWFIDGATGENNITNTIFILILVVPAFFVIGWGMSEIAHPVFAEIFRRLGFGKRR